MRVFCLPSRHKATAYFKTLFAVLCLFAGLLFSSQVTYAAEKVRIGVLENSPPMSWREKDGEFMGYSIDMIKEVCAQRSWDCIFSPSSIQSSIEDLKSGRIDIAAMSLLATPERRAQILLARPYYTSISVWFARTGVNPGDAGVKVAVVSGSAQARFAKSQKWDVVEVKGHTELGPMVISRKADGILAPMMTILGIRNEPSIQAMNLSVKPMKEPELTGQTSFGVSPLRPDLKKMLDATLETLERNGIYDKINSRYVPFRVN